jgi:hypothetical protein
MIFLDPSGKSATAETITFIANPDPYAPVTPRRTRMNSLDYTDASLTEEYQSTDMALMPDDDVIEFRLHLRRFALCPFAKSPQCS